MVDLSVQIGGLALANPVMPASGTFSPDIADVIDPNRLGALVTKSATLAFRAGNPTPRVCETAEGMLNSIGIPSQGIDYFIAEVIPKYRRFTPPLVASVSADTPDEFVAICEKVSIAAVDAIEVNISCPNLEEGGRAYAMRAGTTLSVMRRVRACTDKPLWAKLTPNTGEIANVARAAEEGGADALVVANTVLGMAIDTDTRRPKLKEGELEDTVNRLLEERRARYSQSDISIDTKGKSVNRVAGEIIRAIAERGALGAVSADAPADTQAKPAAEPASEALTRDAQDAAAGSPAAPEASSSDSSDETSGGASTVVSVEADKRGE